MLFTGEGLTETAAQQRAETGKAPGRLAKARAIGLRWDVALFVILLLGALLRFHGLGWDQPEGADYPLQMHPDERFLSIVSNGADWPSSPGEYFDTDTSPLNPYNIEGVNAYVYGTFPLFWQKAVATGADRGMFAPFEWVGLDVPAGDPPGAGNSYNQAVVWGRLLTATVDTITIALVFALGTVLFSRGVGLLAALGYALAVLPTQLAHFFTMDPYVTTFATATALTAVLSVTAQGTRASFTWSALCGVALGLLLASKPSALVLAPLPVLATAARIGLRDLPGLGLRWRGERPSLQGNWASDIGWLSLVMIIGACVFRLTQPYAFVAPDFGSGVFDFVRGVVSIFEINPEWRADIEREQELQSGDVNHPPFVQFADYIRGVTPLEHMVLFGMGPLLGIAGLAGTVAAGVTMFRRRELVFLVPLALAVIIFGFHAPRFVAFMRYFQPMYPVLILFAAWGGLELWRMARTYAPYAPVVDRWPTVRGRSLRLPVRPRGVHLQWGAVAIIGVVVAGTAWWALAFQNVYAETHPRIQASEWIYDNVPAGATISGEAWDDTIPYTLPGGRSSADYNIVTFDIYRTDSPEKIRDLVYGSPDGEREGLDGVDYVAVSSNRVRGSVEKLEREYPATMRYYELLDSGEMGFEPVANFEVRPSLLGISVDDSGAGEAFTVYDHPEVWIYEKTDAWDPDRAFELISEAHPEQAVTLSPAQGMSNGAHLTAEEAETQQQGGTFSDIFDRDGVFGTWPWLWWLILLQVAALATVPWVTWLFRAMPDQGYGLTKVAGFAGLGLITWALVAWDVVQFSGGLVWVVLAGMVVAGLAGGAVRWRALLSDLRGSWKAWVAIEAVFFAVFFGYLLLRAWNPDLWHHPRGGEKPMELAYLTAVARSTILPPFDPWFAGGTMNYYYMGWFLLAAPMRALQMAPEIAFNLGIATYAALTATVAASTGYNLVALSTFRAAALRGARWVRRRAAIAGGVLAVVLLMGIGNLDGGHQAVERLQAVNQWEFLEGVPILGGLVGMFGGLWAWIADGAQLPPFDWWRSSRVHFGQIDITEFPFWTFLFADLHPHLMALPIFGLTIASAIAYIFTAHQGLRVHAWVFAIVLGLVVGLVHTVHTWDLPTAVLIVGAAIITGQFLASGHWQHRLWTALGHLAVVAATYLVVFWPYMSRFETFHTGIERAPETTQPHHYFAHFGLFVAVAIAFLVVRYYEELKLRDREPGKNPALVVVFGWWEVISLGAFVIGLVALTWQFNITVIALSVLILFFLLNLLWLEWRSSERDIARGIATAMLAVAFCIAAGRDIVVLEGDIVRMNTVFKFSIQAWHLFALASAYSAWYVARALWEAEGWRFRVREGRAVAAVAVSVVAVILLAGSLVFPWSGTMERQDQRFASTSPTLDGLVFLEHGEFHVPPDASGTGEDEFIALGEERGMIEWLRGNVQGSPVVAEMVGPLYQWPGRVSMLTGLPAVIGWDWHQTQQRWDYGHLVNERRADTGRFFGDPDVDFAEFYLRKYNVQYVVLGPTERAYADPAGLDKFDEMSVLEAVYEDDHGAVYAVDQDALPVVRP